MPDAQLPARWAHADGHPEGTGIILAEFAGSERGAAGSGAWLHERCCARAGDKLRVRSDTFADHYSQARQFFFSQTEPEQNHIVSAFIFELSKVDAEPVRLRLLGQLAQVDEATAARVADGLGYEGPITKTETAVSARTDLKPSPMLSILAKTKPSLKGRIVGCLVADGTDPTLVTALEAEATAVGAQLKVIAPKVGGAKGSDGGLIRADFQLAGGPSVLFDSVALVLSAEGADMLVREAAAVAFVHDAFSHLKVIGHTAAAQSLMDKAGVVMDEGVVAIGKSGSKAYITAASKGRIWEREPKVRKVF